MLHIESTNQIFYVEDETYSIDPKTGKMNEHPCIGYQGQSFYTVDDAVREMHKVATDKAKQTINKKQAIQLTIATINI